MGRAVAFRVEDWSGAPLNPGSCMAEVKPYALAGYGERSRQRLFASLMTGVLRRDSDASGDRGHGTPVGIQWHIADDLCIRACTRREGTIKESRAGHLRIMEEETRILHPIAFAVLALGAG
jgi:hypothetical protein